MSSTEAHAGFGQFQPLDGSTHHQFVLGMDQGVRSGLDVDPGVLEGAQVRRGDVLVVEGQHVHAFGKAEQGLEVLVVTHR